MRGATTAVLAQPSGGGKGRQQRDMAGWNTRPAPVRATCAGQQARPGDRQEPHASSSSSIQVPSSVPRPAHKRQCRVALPGSQARKSAGSAPNNSRGPIVYVDSSRVMRACVSLFFRPALGQHPVVAAPLWAKRTCAHTSLPSTAAELIEDASGRHITGVAVTARAQAACASQLARRVTVGGRHKHGNNPGACSARTGQAGATRAGRASSVIGSHFPASSAAAAPHARPSAVSTPPAWLLPPSVARAGDLARQRYDRVVLVAASRSSSLHANKGALSDRRGDGPCPERTAQPSREHAPDKCSEASPLA
jgi:hypothetical protein